MEKRMEECARETMQRDPALRGIVCTDSSGTLFCGHGTLQSAHSAAVASQLANLAVALEPNAKPIAIVLSSCSSPSATVPPPPSSSSSLSQQQAQGGSTTNNATSGGASTTAQSGDSKVLIKRNGSITVALHK